VAALGQVITVPTAATRTVAITAGSFAVTDASAAAADAGRAITGTGIPAGAVIGNVTVSTGYDLYLPTENSITVAATATNASLSASLGGILLFQVFDGIVWAKMQSTKATFPLLPQYFRARDVNAPLPLFMGFPASAIFLGGSIVTASSTNVGANINGTPSLAYNCVADDSLYAVVGTSTAAVQLLALGQ
jgi:hypothetical protein